MLNSDESLWVTLVSPPIFGSQRCCRFRNRMQINMGCLRLNTTYNKLPLLFQISWARLWIQSDVNPEGWIRFMDLGWNANKQDMW